MSYISNGASSPCKNKVEAKVFGFKTHWMLCNIPIKKKQNRTFTSMTPPIPWNDLSGVNVIHMHIKALIQSVVTHVLSLVYVIDVHCYVETYVHALHSESSSIIIVHVPFSLICIATFCIQYKNFHTTLSMLYLYVLGL